MATFRDLLAAQGKAFNPNPAWEDPGRPVGVWDLNLGRVAGQSPTRTIGGQRLSQKNAGRHISAYAGAEAMDWVFDCSRFWADTVANAEYHFQTPQKVTAIKTPPKSVDPPAGLEKLLKEPNPYQDYTEMMELLTLDLLLVGNAYLLKWRVDSGKRPLALYRLAPPYVEVATTPWGPGAYIYQIPNADKIEIQPEEIVHIKLANPDGTDPYYGAGIIAGAGRAADLEIGLTKTQQSYYENAAMPSITVQSERRVPRDVFKKMRQQLRNRAQGPSNAGELLILEAGLTMNSIAPSAVDAAFANMASMSRDRVFSWFKMHPILVGLQTEGNIAAGFLSEMQKQFDTKAMRPFLNKLQLVLTMQLIKAWNLEYVIDYEYQMSPEERAAHAQMVGGIPGTLVDEVREAGGMPPHPDKAIGKVALGLPGEEGGDGSPGNPTRNGHPDPHLKGEKGRPPKGENTKAFPTGNSKLTSTAKARRSAGKAGPIGYEGLEEAVALHNARVLGPRTVEDVSARLDELASDTKAIETPAEREPVDQLEHMRVADVDDVTAGFTEALGRAAHVLERALLDTVEGKSLESDIVTKLRSSHGWGAFEPLAQKAYEDALLRVMSAAAVHHGKLGLKPAGDIDYHALIDDLVGRKDSGVNAITKSLKDQIARDVKEARQSKADIDAALQQSIKKWVADKAEMIALTEATRGYNEATLAVAESIGVEKVHVSDGTDDDAPCVEANGAIWDLAYAREHALEHPRCRRAFVPITA